MVDKMMFGFSDECHPGYGLTKQAVNLPKFENIAILEGKRELVLDLKDEVSAIYQMQTEGPAYRIFQKNKRTGQFYELTPEGGDGYETLEIAKGSLKAHYLRIWMENNDD